MIPLNIDVKKCRYHALIGVGGIGTGKFFALLGNATLGREESRLGYFIDRKDYCKLHIAAHYVKVLLGPEFSVLPVGKVGDDDAGRELVQEMQEVGLDLKYVERCPGYQTLYSFCFIYPDGSGGNLTTADSACSQVDARTVEEAREDFSRFSGHGIALAMPEVPLEARERLIQLGNEHDFFCVGSFVSDEIKSVVKNEMLKQIDLLALNIDEAAAAVEMSAEEKPVLEIVEQSTKELSKINPKMLISITAGKQGSWSWEGTSLTHIPGIEVQAKSTAGAGDAHLSGLLTGLTAGLSLSKAQELANLIAALSVESEHTINKDIDGLTLREFVQSRQIKVCDEIKKLLTVHD
jgi:ribokinase